MFHYYILSNFSNFYPIIINFTLSFIIKLIYTFLKDFAFFKAY